MVITLSRGLSETLMYSAETDNSVEGYYYHDDVLLSTGRWTEQRLLVIEDWDGALYAAEYERGLTEMQDEAPWYGQNEVEFHPVTKETIVTYANLYERIKNDDSRSG